VFDEQRPAPKHERARRDGHDPGNEM